MPSHRTQPKPLSDSEIRRIAADVEAGRRRTVWFTADAVGMTEGRSGKVVAVADRSEPDYLRVRPSGSSDTLAFSPAELTLTRPERQAAPKG
ncbi:hypothetical protein [Nocardia pseudobrasiliensis]|uniref:Uncharacterized protein n=1 Tax=Nocardia pseudobrasiliensis TaxID=45979 RepID=A0A370HZI0_9NOCA|nr:hypothetical protein [Nocardia pseudobrasiliensis]RDI63896.1 hypothetical protein DFR76_109236 [Nocardia pseudobrasiliensis]